MVLPVEALAIYAEIHTATCAPWVGPQSHKVSWKLFSRSTQPRFARKMHRDIVDVGVFEMHRDTMMDIEIVVHCESILHTQYLEPLAPNLLIPIAPCVSLH